MPRNMYIEYNAFITNISIIEILHEIVENVCFREKSRLQKLDQTSFAKEE